MGLAAAKEKCKKVAAGMQAIVDDDSFTLEEKTARLDLMKEDFVKASDEVQLHQSVSEMIGTEFDSKGMADADIGDSMAEKRGYEQSIGEQFARSEAYKSFANRMGRAWSQSSSGAVEVKTINTIDAGTLLSGVATPNYIPGVVQTLTRPLYVADLMPSGTTDQPILSYVVESQWQNSAAAVLEKGTKPQSDLTLGRVTTPVQKIATTFKVTDEALADIPMIQGYVNARGVLGVKIVEENELLSGSGTAPHLKGILSQTGLQTALTPVATANVPDSIFTMMTTLRSTAFIEPSAIVIHPTDWMNLRLLKDANGQYLAGGPFTGTYGTTPFSNVGEIWGLRVVATPAIAQHTILVGGFDSCAMVFRRQGITVEATNSNEDDFKTNLVAIRVEERLGLAVWRPAGFGTITTP